MKKLRGIYSILYFTVCSLPILAQEMNVVVSAHPDDWQLFMNPNAYHSLDSITDKTIFLHTTAGDAGAEVGNKEYYKAREEGSLRAIRFMVNAQGHKMDYGKNMNEKLENINGHNIASYTYANAKAYMLRLHDGFIVTDTMIEHPQSLRNFYNNKIENITTIDETSTYKNVEDLRQTLKELIDQEAKGYKDIVFHLADTDSIVNPNDHPDHLHTSLIMQEVAEDIGGVKVLLYQEYSSNRHPLNQFPKDYLISAGTWGATASGLSDFGHYTTWDDSHNAWIGRQYFRVKEDEE